MRIFEVRPLYKATTDCHASIVYNRLSCQHCVQQTVMPALCTTDCHASIVYNRLSCQYCSGHRMLSHTATGEGQSFDFSPCKCFTAVLWLGKKGLPRKFTYVLDYHITLAFLLTAYVFGSAFFLLPGSKYLEPTPCFCLSFWICQFLQIFLGNLSFFKILFFSHTALR